MEYEDWKPGTTNPPHPPDERPEDRLVECVECGQFKSHDIDDCTPVSIDGHIHYLCNRHVGDYTCDLCDRVEYTPECKATRWCADCAAEMDTVAEDIIADFEIRGVSS